MKTTKKEYTTIKIEHTDTYGGESNYSWVSRYEKQIADCTPLKAVRAAKSATGLNGIPARVEHYGDMIAIYPRGICQVVFITFDY